MSFQQSPSLITERCIDNSPHNFIELTKSSGTSLDMEMVVNLCCSKCLKVVTIKVNI
jgi:hypothetical protein